MISIGTSIIVKQSLKHLMRPKIRDTKKVLKEYDIEFDKLFLLASFSRLSYKSFQNVKETSFQISRHEPVLIDLLKKSTRPMYNEFIIFENEAKNKNVEMKVFRQPNSIQGFAWISNDVVYIIFKGSENLYDFLTNIDMKQVSIPWLDNRKIKVHQGYLKQFQNMKEHISQFLKNHISKIKKVFFIGHSRGGSISHIAALYYNNFLQQQNKSIQINCVSFGSPCTGNKAFVDYYCQQKELALNTCRIYHYEDIVAYLPLSPSYYHINSNTLCIHLDGNLKMNYFEPDLPLIRFFQFFITIRFFNLIKAHNIITYMLTLQNLFSKWKKIE